MTSQQLCVHCISASSHTGGQSATVASCWIQETAQPGISIRTSRPHCFLFWRYWWIRFLPCPSTGNSAHRVRYSKSVPEARDTQTVHIFFFPLWKLSWQYNYEAMKNSWISLTNRQAHERPSPALEVRIGRDDFFLSANTIGQNRRYKRWDLSRCY